MCSSKNTFCAVVSDGRNWTQSFNFSFAERSRDDVITGATLHLPVRVDHATGSRSQLRISIDALLDNSTEDSLVRNFPRRLEFPVVLCLRVFVADAVRGALETGSRYLTADFRLS